MISRLAEVVPSQYYHCGSTLFSTFSVGAVSARVEGSGECVDVSLDSLLEPFRTDVSNPVISIKVERMKYLSSVVGGYQFDSGSIWRLHDAGREYQFDFHAPVFGKRPYKRLFVDKSFRKAVLEMAENSWGCSTYQLTPLEYPLDELLIMHRLTQERAIELHGTGIVRANGIANLFVGHSGAGKSTTTRLWTSREEVEVLSDDRIIVRYDDGRDGPAGPTQMRMYGTPWHGEAMFASPNSAPLTRIFVLEHGHGNVITRLSRSEAVGELFARAFVPFHRHEYLENALSFLEQLVSSVPCYRYSFEPTDAAVEKIQQFHD
jgi:hypothetical protein